MERLAPWHKKRRMKSSLQKELEVHTKELCEELDLSSEEEEDKDNLIAALLCRTQLRRSRSDHVWEESWLDKELLARLPVRNMVPEYHELCKGCSHDWNYKVKSFTWNGKIKQRHKNSQQPGAPTPSADFEIFQQFLAKRVTSEGQPLMELLGQGEPQADGWMRYPWAGMVEKNLPTKSKGKHAHNGSSDWQRAWHGCKLEALYSIMYHGRLAASCDAERGDRFFPEAPGVYCHGDGNKEKALNYTRFVPLCRDGVVWSAKWELRVDRADRVAVKKTDQWVQPERSVQLAALWVCGKPYADLEAGLEIQECWDGELEANPRRTFKDGPLPESSEDDLRGRPFEDDLQREPNPTFIRPSKSMFVVEVESSDEEAARLAS